MTEIMLVEDDQPILDLMEILLRRLGYEPVIIPDVREALERIRTDPPALILLDLMMAPVNGWEFLEKLRGVYGMCELPVLLFTASSTVDEKIADLNDPFLGVLKKPASIDELRAGIEQFLPGQGLKNNPE